MKKTSRAVAALLAVTALVVAACGGSDDDKTSSGSGAAKTSSNKPVTINWWHIANNDPLKTIWKNAADQYMADNPNVDIRITVLNPLHACVGGHKDKVAFLGLGAHPKIIFIHT